jgi:hypothetical protein
MNNTTKCKTFSAKIHILLLDHRTLDQVFLARKLEMPMTGEEALELYTEDPTIGHGVLRLVSEWFGCWPDCWR